MKTPTHAIIEHIKATGNLFTSEEMFNFLLPHYPEVTRKKVRNSMSRSALAGDLTIKGKKRVSYGTVSIYGASEAKQDNEQEQHYLEEKYMVLCGNS